MSGIEVKLFLRLYLPIELHINVPSLSPPTYCMTAIEK